MVSVVIPAYNSERFIRRTINSVLSQTYKDFEIIVVDDGSTDKTREVLKEYGPEVRYIHQENAGDGPARNTGIAAARYDWIAFLDHDDEWVEEKLEIQVNLLKANPQLHWCASNYIRKSGKTEELAKAVNKAEKLIGGSDYIGDFFSAMSQMKFTFMSSTIVVCKSVFEKVGGFDSCWLRGADQDMWWRIAYLYPQIGYSAKPLATLYIDPQDIVSTRLRLETKRGGDTRKLVSKHLKLAEEYNCSRTFVPYAKKLIRKRVIVALYHGFKSDTLAFVKEFPEFFAGIERVLVYLLLIFPELTSFCLKSAARLAKLIGLDRSVSRRWVKVESEKRDSE